MRCESASFVKVERAGSPGVFRRAPEELLREFDALVGELRLKLAGHRKGLSPRRALGGTTSSAADDQEELHTPL
jgi:hypothetical protein